MNAEFMKLLERIELKLDAQGKEIADNTKATIANTLNLEVHMKRSDALEKIVAELQTFTAKWAGAWTLLAILAAFGSIVTVVLRLLGKI